jgi:hypothetical protein
MENIDQNLIIDEIVTALSLKDRENLLQLCLDKFGNANYSEFKKIIILLQDRNIILPLDGLMNKDYHKLTALGREVVDTGGWKKYNEKKKKEELEQSLVKEKENAKLNYEIQLAKWQVKAFWPLFGIALLGAICGIISLLLQLF